MNPRQDVLDRIHAAAPVSGSYPDADQLWAQITASPRDPRLDSPRARPSRRRHALRLIPSVLAVALAVGIAVAALALLRHGSGRPSPAPSGGATSGQIVDRHGVVLAGATRAGLQGTYNRYARRGDTLTVSVDAQLQRVGQRALATSLQRNGASGGAFVAMNPDNGQVYAMGSLAAVGPGSTAIDRVTQSAGPTGAAFTPITALAALESGQWRTAALFDDTGQFCVGTGAAEQCRHNAGHAVDGTLNLVDALRVSSSDFFYNLGARLNEDPRKVPNGGPLDTWAYALGFGRPTGIGLPGESAGTLPTPNWRQRRNRLEAECDSATGPFAWTDGHGTSSQRHEGWHRSRTHPPGGCGIADGTNRPWSIGDNESLSVGQGDLQVTPIQLAVAYAALANDGTIVRPHLGMSVKDASGKVIRTISPPPARRLSLNPSYLQAVRQGLHAAAQSPGGTSDDVMGSFPMTVYGKAGTAQYVNQPDYAWYAGFVTDTDKPIVVVVHVEKAGFGDVAAAPVARQILSQWFYGTPGRYRAGTNSSL